MYFALIYYPEIELKGFHLLRQRYEPYASLLPEHLPFLHPVPASIGVENISIHINKILQNWLSFDVHFKGLEKSWDQWLLLVLKEGRQQVLDLHDALYADILSPYLRKDLPYIPHVALGLFSKEGYDVNNPTSQLSLDEEKYLKARKEFEKLKLDFWRKIDQLTLIKINSDFSKCWDIEVFKLKSQPDP
jgi:hypothetical protein